MAQFSPGFGEQFEDAFGLRRQIRSRSLAVLEPRPQRRVLLGHGAQLVGKGVHALSEGGEFLGHTVQGRGDGGIGRWRGHAGDYTLAARAGDGACMSPVLVLAPYVPHPLTHGGSIRTRILLEAIAEDHPVHFVAPVVDEVARENLAALASAVGLQAHPVAVPRHPKGGFVRKLRAWARGRSELLARRWGDTAAAEVAAIAEAVRPAAIVADSSFVFPVLPPIPAPLILHLHNLEGGVFARPGGKRSFAERVTRRFEARTITAIEARVLRRAAATITVSELDREGALALAKAAHIVTVPVSVDLARLVPLPPLPASPGPLRLLFVGTIDYPPNFEAIAELVEQHLPVLRAAFPGLVVRLVGRDDADRLGVFRGREGVEVVGTVDDVVPHYAVSHAVYLPIRTGGGTRGKIIEAWALGRPVLATAVGAEALAGEEGVHWRRFETPADGVRALREVLAGAGPAMVRAGRELAEARYGHAAAVAALRAVVRAVTGAAEGGGARRRR